MVIQLRLLESYYNDLATRETILSQALAENRAALSAISVLSEKEESEVAIPIGGGLFLPTNYKPEKKLLVRIGANIVMEKGKEEAAAFLSKRIEEIEKVLKEIAAQKEETARRMEILRAELEKISKQ